MSRALTPSEKKSINVSKSATDKQHNHFENIKQRRKFDALGVKKQEIHFSKQHSRQINERKNTLLKDFYRSKNANQFVDMREQDNNIPAYRVETKFDKLTKGKSSLTEKALQKIQKIGAKRKRESKFSLGDDDDSGAPQQTTMGGPIFGDLNSKLDSSLRNDYEDNEKLDDDDDERKPKRQKVYTKHLGDVEKTEAPKSKKEIMQEVIKNSKKQKGLNKLKKEENEELILQLDDQFADLEPLLKKKTKFDKEIIPKDEVNKDYDLALKTLMFDGRVQPAPKTKSTTAEQQALEEKEELELLEQERQKQIEAGTISGDNAPKISGISSADSLDDGYDLEVDNSEDIELDEDDEPAKATSKAASAPKEAVASDDEDDEEKEDEEEEKQEKKVQEKPKEVKLDSDSELLAIPYVIQAPSDYEEFMSLIKDRSPKQIEAIFQRIRKTNNQNLGKKNQHAMENFLSLLVEHFINEVKATNYEHDTRFKILNIMHTHIFELAMNMPSLGQTLFFHLLKQVEETVLGHIVHIEKAALLEEDDPKAIATDGFPEFGVLLTVKLFSNILPLADYSNPLLSPILTLLHQCISSSRIYSLRDISAGLMFSATALHYVQESKKVSPEAINFLSNVLGLALKTSKKTTIRASLASNNATYLFIDQDIASKASIKPVAFKYIVSKANIEKETAEVQQNLKLSLLYTAVDLLHQFCTIYGRENLVAVPELFAPALENLKEIEKYVSQYSAQGEGCKKLLKKLKEAKEYIQTQFSRITSDRRPLDYLSAKPVALPEFEPLIYSETFKGRLVDRNEDRLDHKILKNKLKREYKAAAREIRRDNTFMRKAREQDMARTQWEQKQKYKQIMGELQTQQTQLLQYDNSRYQEMRQIKQERKKRKQRGQQPIN